VAGTGNAVWHYAAISRYNPPFKSSSCEAAWSLSFFGLRALAIIGQRRSFFLLTIHGGMRND
jgi:hypothetical protein